MWLSYDEHPAWFTRPLFTNLDEVYGNGEFTSRGLFTVTEPANEIHLDLLDAWEMDAGSSVSRWSLPVAPTARVCNIHRPGDWVALVAAYPKVATAAHGGWELPGPNQHREEIDALLQVPGQNAARIVVDRHVLPDWRAVATDYDGVHLSWAGVLTTEGFVSDLPDGGATMLRYWFTERTLWLADVFGQPAPLGAPSLTGEGGGTVGFDAAHDPSRRERDLHVIHSQLGR